MRVGIFLLVALALGIAWMMLRPRRVASTHKIRVDDIPRVFDQIIQSSARPTFAVIAFSTADRPDTEDAVNLQFSIEGGRPGFDWVLTAPRNLQDKDAFLAFAANAGYFASAKEMNRVKYLRIEDGNLPRLCVMVATEMYRLRPSDEVELIPEGFEWRA